MPFVKRSLELSSWQFYLLGFWNSYCPFGIVRALSSLILDVAKSWCYSATVIIYRTTIISDETAVNCFPVCQWRSLHR